MLEAFKDALYCISASIAAGRQLPFAIEDAANQSELFGDILSDEFHYIVDVYKETHGNTEELLMDLADRSGIEEIKLFAMSCRICRKSGGDLEKVCLRSAFLLIERIDYQNEVSAVLSEKKLDSLILMAMPPLILFFLNMTAYDYVAILYESFQGRIIMSFCLLLMVLAGLWSLKLMTLDL